MSVFSFMDDDGSTEEQETGRIPVLRTTGKNATAIHGVIAVRGLHGKAGFAVRE
jgi:hypothetical protein